MASLLGKDTILVFDSFRAGKERFRSRPIGRRRIWTDGVRIYSYGMAIAESYGPVIVLNQAAFSSTMTTRRHVRAIMRLAETAGMKVETLPLRSL